MSDERTAEVGTQSAWQRFWARGGWWKALAVAVIYAALYEGFGLLDGALFGGLVDTKNPFANAQSVFFGVALPILLGGIALFIFVSLTNQRREIFGRQPIRGRWWMWIAVVLVIIPIVLRVAGTNWSKYSVGVVLTTLLLGVFVGFAEELLTRGIVVNLLRRAGYGERVVLVLSSLVFALLHSVNAFTQPIVAVLVTVVYTFGFGAMMYLAMRVTGSIFWAMLLHAATDPTTILATGGIDVQTASSGSAALLGFAGIFNFIYIAAAIIAIILVRGKVYPDRSPRKRVASEREG
jgi:membrane protease YdiL (CAAX protease family)